MYPFLRRGLSLRLDKRVRMVHSDFESRKASGDPNNEPCQNCREDKHEPIALARIVSTICLARC